MNTTRIGLISLAVAGAPLFPITRLAADVEPAHRSSAATAARLRTTTKDEYKERSFDKLRGEAVRGADGKDLGHIGDLVLDARTGEVRFVVVSAGGFVGMGGDSRLLPVSALIRDPKEKSFLTRLQRVDWELLPTLNKDDVKEGRIAFTSEQRRNVSQLRQQEWARAFDGLEESHTDPRVQRYVFASALAGKPLHAEDEKVGKVEDLYVDLAGQPVSAVVQIDGDYTDGRDHEYLVPIESLQVPAGQNGRVHTNLAAAEFQQAAGITPDSTARDAGPWVRRRDRARGHDTAVRDDLGKTRLDVGRERDATVAPAPTGFPSTYGETRATRDLMTSAARTVRDHWDADRDLKRYNLNAQPDAGRLVLSGVVPTRALADRAEDIARRTTERVTIENQIRVDDTRR